MKVQGSGNRFQVTITIDDLNEERFTLTYLDSRQYFQYTEYKKFHRQSRRHKFLAVESWSWYEKRNNTISTPPVPTDDILRAVKECFINQISFRLEIER